MRAKFSLSCIETEDTGPECMEYTLWLSGSNKDDVDNGPERRKGRHKWTFPSEVPAMPIIPSLDKAADVALGQL